MGGVQREMLQDIRGSDLVVGGVQLLQGGSQQPGGCDVTTGTGLRSDEGQQQERRHLDRTLVCCQFLICFICFSFFWLIKLTSKVFSRFVDKDL